jgi:hypothetical protein
MCGKHLTEGQGEKGVGVVVKLLGGWEGVEGRAGREKGVGVAV